MFFCVEDLHSTKKRRLQTSCVSLLAMIILQQHQTSYANRASTHGEKKIKEMWEAEMCVSLFKRTMFGLAYVLLK